MIEVMRPSVRDAIRSAPSILILTFAACSTLFHSSEPEYVERYRELDGIQKKAFIAYYPRLQPHERARLIEELENRVPPEIAYLHIQENARAAKGLEPIPNASPVPIPTHHLSGLTIETTGPTGSRSLELRAVARYSDGESAEVTADVVWTVEPALASIRGNTLRYDCVHSDVEVNARFFDDAEAKRVIPLLKDLRSIELERGDPADAKDHSEFVKLRLVAHCADGTTSDVTCQADWKISTAGLEMRGCGTIHRLGPASQALVSVSYGGLEATRAIELPLRSASGDRANP